MRNAKNVLMHELIGVGCNIIGSKNKSNTGIRGKITDETKNTLVIGNKRVFKNNITIALDINNETIIINGRDLLGRPKERIKK
jgi:ribonuclease P protein subunit POP4